MKRPSELEQARARKDSFSEAYGAETATASAVSTGAYAVSHHITHISGKTVMTKT